MTADTAPAESRTTEVAVVFRVYQWLDTALPRRINMIAHEVGRAFQAIRITHFIPEALQFWLALKRLQRAKSKLYDLYGKRHEEYLELNADAGQIEQLNYDEAYELAAIHERIYQLYSQRIIAQAERYFLPIPNIQDQAGGWELARISGRLRLQREVLQSLLAAVRAKQQERRGAAQANLIWVTALTGMIGAVIGLISVLSR